MTKQTILVVEDDKSTAAMLTAALDEAGYCAVCADSIASATHLIKGHQPDLIVLDIRLPDGNGLELCEKIRKSGRLSTTPIIALTGMGEPHHKMQGFTTGVDQYLVKPIDLQEFVLWVTALLRRVEMDKDGNGLIADADLSINTEAQILCYKGQTVENLTKREFDLFLALVKESPKILSRRYIISKVWQTVAVENLVDTHIFNIRRKFPRELAAKVQSVPGKGFRYFNP